LPHLPAVQRAVLALALTGFYKLGDVDLVWEQLESTCPMLGTDCEVADAGLVVRLGAGSDTEVVYDLDERPVLHPRVVRGRPAPGLPPLESERVLFRSRPVLWRDWVAAWECVHAGEVPLKPPLPGVRLLPPESATVVDAEPAEARDAQRR